jgi:hypothetical protein
MSCCGCCRQQSCAGAVRRVSSTSAAPVWGEAAEGLHVHQKTATLSCRRAWEQMLSMWGQAPRRLQGTWWWLPTR